MQDCLLHAASCQMLPCWSTCWEDTRISLHRLPCHAMLCHAVPCYAMLCYAMLCYVLCAMLCYAMLCYVMLCHAMPCHAMLRHTMLCKAMQQCYVLCWGFLYASPVGVQATWTLGGRWWTWHSWHGRVAQDCWCRRHAALPSPAAPDLPPSPSGRGLQCT